MIAKVLVEISSKNIDKTFDYIVSDKFKSLIKVGMRVKVPFATRILEGFVLELSDNCNNNYELKEIIDIVDYEIILNKELLALGKYMQDITLSTLISCYQTMLPKALKAKHNSKINKKLVPYLKLGTNKDCKLTNKQQEIVALFKDKEEILKKDINSSVIKTLIDKKVLELFYKEVYRYNDNYVTYENYKLTNKQQEIVSKVLENKDKNDVFLLHGVTGSGKTLIYMEIIANLLKEGKSSILLVPEISLTEQIVSRFRSRFKDNIAILHSRLSEGEKYDEYRKIYKNEVKIVIGARSAIFAPLKNIGIIILDEEHTDSYKQDSMNPKYNALDIAKFRGKYLNIPVLLGSATPSLESYSRSSKGVYKLLELNERVNNKKLPLIDIIDMNKEIKKRKGSFSNKLIEEINNTLNNNKQVILLLNRRGYSSFISCKNCGNVIKCPNCDITLTYHKSSNTLRCHYCGYGTNVIKTCPNCHEEALTNLGVGTEKIEEELNKLFKDKKVIRMDYDTTVNKGSHEKIIKSFQNHEYDILLGTQMVAKGLDFPDVTLVGVINSDTSLNIPDFRSSETTFELLCQVAGRSGRGNNEGKVIIQTFNPDHYAIKYAKYHDYKGFYQREMFIRHKLCYPPYYYLTLIRVISKDYDLSLKTASKVAKYLNDNLDNVKILGPSIASLFKVNNKYRFQILIKSKNISKQYPILIKLLEHYKNNNNINIDIDFNPLHV